MKTKNTDLLTIDGTRSTVTLGVSRNFKPMHVGNANVFNIQCVFTGTPAGEFKLQASNDLGNLGASGDSAQYNGVSNWSDVANSEFTVSAAGDIMWNQSAAGMEWVRVVYTASGAGSGSPTVTILRGVKKAEA